MSNWRVAKHPSFNCDIYDDAERFIATAVSPEQATRIVQLLNEATAKNIQAGQPSEDWWDQHSVQCGNCSVEILTRKGCFSKNNGLSDPGDSEDEALCGRCAGAQMYIYMDQIDQIQARPAWQPIETAPKVEGH